MYVCARNSLGLVGNQMCDLRVLGRRTWGLWAGNSSHGSHLADMSPVGPVQLDLSSQGLRSAPFLAMCLEDFISGRWGRGEESRLSCLGEEMFVVGCNGTLKAFFHGNIATGLYALWMESTLFKVYYKWNKLVGYHEHINTGFNSISIGKYILNLPKVNCKGTFGMQNFIWGQPRIWFLPGMFVVRSINVFWTWHPKSFLGPFIVLECA